MTETPTVARIVHYVARGSADGAFPSVCRAAIVTATPPAPLPDGAISLAVLNPSGMFFDEDIRHHPGVSTDVADADQRGALCVTGDRVYPGGSWHWPERAPQPA